MGNLKEVFKINIKILMVNIFLDDLKWLKRQIKKPRLNSEQKALTNLKSGSQLKKNGFICFNESSFKMMKNAYYC